jgi:hypothetical protein
MVFVIEEKEMTKEITVRRHNLYQYLMKNIRYKANLYCDFMMLLMNEKHALHASEKFEHLEQSVIYNDWEKRGYHVATKKKKNHQEKTGTK